MAYIYAIFISILLANLYTFTSKPISYLKRIQMQNVVCRENDSIAVFGFKFTSSSWPSIYNHLIQSSESCSTWQVPDPPVFALHKDIMGSLRYTTAHICSHQSVSQSIITKLTFKASRSLLPGLRSLSVVPLRKVLAKIWCLSSTKLDWKKKHYGVNN